MSYLLFPSSGNHVTLDPNWNFKRDDKKVQDTHRTRSGARYDYKWGQFVIFKFGVDFVSSATQAIVNSWWSTNTKLLFMESGGAQVFSVKLSNGDLPIGEFVKPYTDQYRGVIELEGY